VKRFGLCTHPEENLANRPPSLVKASHVEPSRVIFRNQAIALYSCAILGLQRCSYSLFHHLTHCAFRQLLSAFQLNVWASLPRGGPVLGSNCLFRCKRLNTTQLKLDYSELHATEVCVIVQPGVTRPIMIYSGMIHQTERIYVSFCVGLGYTRVLCVCSLVDTHSEPLC
jgi:hypothetical protein